MFVFEFVVFNLLFNFRRSFKAFSEDFVPGKSCVVASVLWVSRGNPAYPGLMHFLDLPSFFCFEKGRLSTFPLNKQDVS